MGGGIYVIQHRVSKLCEQEAGLTVYVTPEEWRKQIGEEEWAQQYDDGQHIDENLAYTFNGMVYYGNARLNKRIYIYVAHDPRPDDVADYNDIFVDNINRKSSII